MASFWVTTRTTCTSEAIDEGPFWRLALATYPQTVTVFLFSQIPSSCFHSRYMKTTSMRPWRHSSTSSRPTSSSPFSMAKEMKPLPRPDMTPLMSMSLLQT